MFRGRGGRAGSGHHRGLESTFGHALVVVTGMLVPACGNDMHPKERGVLGRAPDRLVASTSAGPDYRAELAALSPELQSGVPAGGLQRMVDYLTMRIPKDAVIDTVRSRGDVFDCVDINEQPSVRQLRAQGVSVDVDKRPPKPPAVGEQNPAPAGSGIETAPPRLEQPCPDRTIPIRRIPLSEVAQYGSLEAYLTPPAFNRNEHAAARKDVTNYGGEALLNIWNPSVETTSDFSLTQIWVTDLAHGDTVEAGSIRHKYQNARLFVFFTANDYGPGSCWNTDCGFVHTGGSIPLDGEWPHYSVSGGNQYGWRFAISKDGPNGDWWFSVGYEWVGYWPRSLFGGTGLAQNAVAISFGGEIYDATGTFHTTTDMGGDGSFSYAGFGHAAFQLAMRYYTYSAGTLYWWRIGSCAMDMFNPNCYSIAGYSTDDPVWGDYIFFGGPGYSARYCSD